MSVRLDLFRLVLSVRVRSHLHQRRAVLSASGWMFFSSVFVVLPWSALPKHVPNYRM